MKAQEVKDLRGKSAAELKALVLEKRREQFNARMQHGSGQGPKPHAVREMRRDIARLKTILSEKKRSA
ncbi:MAG: 50S ribosomal protein L29 [Gammaproteobacteria bacterium]|nr:50S ribosomal protein L29 [Gammaproteobacteria bacterium]